MSQEEKKARKESGNDKPDVGIFACSDDDVGAACNSVESPLIGFCATYKKAHSPRHSRRTDESVGEKNEGNEEAEDETVMDPPSTKKQRTAPAHKPSLLLDSYADILENVYSFLTLKEALVLRRICRQLNNDTDIFRCSIIVDSNTLSRIAIPSHRHESYLDRQDQERCNLANAANLRALLANGTLPQDMIVNFLKKVIERSKTDNGEAISVLLQDDRVLVEPSMLDKVLRKDFSAMAAALQQNEAVRAAIRICTTCSVSIGTYECLNGANCAYNLKHDKEKTSLPPKYCCACMRSETSRRFCICGEYVCQDCIDADNFMSCDDCEAIVCSWEKCALSVCPNCNNDVCSRCTLQFAPMCNSCGDESEEYSYDSYGTYDNDYYLHSDDDGWW